MSTQSLVLQRVGVDAVGDYTCRAINSEGSGESNPVNLKIMCKLQYLQKGAQLRAGVSFLKSFNALSSSFEPLQNLVSQTLS